MSISVADIKEQLPLYGYTPTEKDSPLIRQCTEHVILRVKSYINHNRIYPELESEVIRMCVGEFLYQKKRSPDGLQDGGIVFPKRLAQITEGDTSLSYTRSDLEESNFDDMINEMRYGDYFILEHFRKVHW